MPPRTPRVPGDVVTEKTVTDQADQQSDVTGEAMPGDAGLTGDNPVAEETVTVSKSSLDALMARVDALESAKQAPVRAVDQSAALPDQHEINPDKIKSPVLTKQGWIVPTNFGANPAAKAL